MNSALNTEKLVSKFHTLPGTKKNRILPRSGYSSDSRGFSCSELAAQDCALYFFYKYSI